MDIWHHIALASKDKVDSLLKSLQIPYKRTPPEGNSYLISFDIEESDPRWPQIESFAQMHNAVNIYDTVFTEDEIRASEWSRLIPKFQQGYPQPQKTWSRNPINYKSFCSECGAGFEQITPFQISQEPRMTRNDFVSLIWTYGLFGTQKVFNLFATAGIRSYQAQDVLSYKTGNPFCVIRQVLIPGITTIGLLNTEKLEHVVCPHCGLSKYSYHKRGYMHYRRDALPMDADMVQSYEWFGYGGSAFREILVSRKVAMLILEYKLRGVALKPISPF